MIVKVCGMTQSDNIQKVAELDIDWIGMIFYPLSPRYVSEIPTISGILPNKATPLSAFFDGKKRVGVFVDCMTQTMITHIVNYQLDIIQLHGQEPPILLKNLRDTIDPDIKPNIQIIKTIGISCEDDLKACEKYYDCADFFLFDTSCDTLGGSGRQYNWHILEAYNGPLPFLLSGGIGPCDVQNILSFKHPCFAGIDLNSRFEISPGIKDVPLLRTFIDNLNKENNSNRQY